MPIKNKILKRKYDREWIAKRRADFFADKMCWQCGSKDSLELHHKDPSTKVAHRIWSWSLSRREIEIAKCIVLCESCHAEHHAQLIRKSHGTAASYHRGCRCQECKRAESLQKKVYKEKKKNNISNHIIIYKEQS